MGNVLVNETSLENIADAIRDKSGTQDTYTPAQMATAISNIHTGGTPVSSITITNKASLQNLTLASDGTYTTYPLNVTVLPADAPQITQVTVSDSSVAQVIDNGNGTHSLRVIGGGSTLVTVSDYENNESDSFTMTVTVPVLAVAFVNSSVDVPTGGTRQMQLKWTPSYATDKSGTWSSNSQDITVDQNGLVTASSSATTDATISFTSTALGTTITATASPKTYDTNPDWAAIQTAVAAGERPFNIGSELTLNWKQYTSASNYTQRQITMVVMHYDTIEDENGNQKPGMYLQAKELLPNTLYFENEQRVKATETNAQAGVFYYGNTGSTYTALNLQVGDPVPYELYTNVYKSGIDFSKNVNQISQSGLGWWKDSSIRQYLNSESSAQGFGWTSLHISDTNGNSGQYGGFLRGCDADFLAVLKPVKVQTARNNVIWNQETDVTYDKIFLPSNEQVGAGAPSGVTAGTEGTIWDYYSTGGQSSRIKKPIGQTSANYWWLRSANPTNAYREYYINSSGALNFSYANYSNCAAPACVIY